MEWTPRHPPYSHQAQVLATSIDEEYWGLFLDMGTGKSKVSLDTLAHWFAEGRLDRALILGNKGDYANWFYDQLPEHWPTELAMSPLLYSSYRVHTAEFKREWGELLALPKTTMKILVANVESMRVDSRGNGGRLDDLLHDFTSRQKFALIMDESTSVKSATSAQSRGVYKYAARAKMRRILTGTAVNETPLDLWGQHLVLKKGILGHSSFTSFRSEYTNKELVALPTGALVNKWSGVRSQEKLTAVIKTFSSQVLKSDCLDLPEKVYSKQVVDLEPKHRATYDKLRREAMLEIQDREMEILHSMALSSKMHQLAAGQVKDEEGNYHWVGSAKLEALVDVLSDYTGKAVIWCPYKAPLLEITRRLNKEFGQGSAVGYYGGVADSDRQANLTGFKDKSSGVRFFVANQMSAGYGITMTIAKLHVYYSNSYKLELRLQSEDRSHRIGQDASVTYLDLIAHDTVDTACYAALRTKRTMADLIMSRPPADWL